MRMIVIGGGIGGLTAAIALGRAGIEVDVYEQATELREVGAGIALASNALRALWTLGLAGELKAQSFPAIQGGLRRPNGDVLVSIPADELSRQIGTVAVMHRAELLSMLARRVDAARVHQGRRCVSVSEGVGGATVRFDTGETASADGVIAADGLRSVVRGQVFGDRMPRYAGYTAWRAVVGWSGAELPAGETWGRGRRFGIVPMSGGRVYWFAVQNAPEGGRDPEGRTKAALAELFRGWHPPIEALIDSSREGSILRNNIYDIDPLPRIVNGRVALLGDAAHAMTPNLGQGACQAIEDGVVLAATLRTTGDVTRGFEEYEIRRRPRTRRIQIWSRWIGKVAQLENPTVCRIRDFAMRMAPRTSGPRRMQSLFGEEILTPEEEGGLIVNPSRCSSGWRNPQSP